MVLTFHLAVFIFQFFFIDLVFFFHFVYHIFNCTIHPNMSVQECMQCDHDSWYDYCYKCESSLLKCLDDTTNIPIDICKIILSYLEEDRGDWFGNLQYECYDELTNDWVTTPSYRQMVSFSSSLTFENAKGSQPLVRQ